jgi:asparagine synthase (glutamine-hydrolysing)
MCGICGAIDFSGSSDASALVRRMTPTMTHRGPDDDGYLDHGRVSLGMRRLSIIDLEGGHQPIFNEDGLIGGVLNGEIYNFQELRKQLQDRGHNFRTRSDSEVAVHAYQEWGSECVEHFEGMFALAILDRRGTNPDIQKSSQAGVPGSKFEVDATLFLARDRLGIKPLYYYAGESRASRPDSNSTTFLFASEVRTLLASGIVSRQLSRAALESYFLFGSVGEPMTLVEGVLSLPPGHWMTIRVNENATPETNVRRYWSISARKENNGSTNGRSAVNDRTTAARRVRELLEDSVRKHLIADVPAGVFLSGGIDSTSLAALASRENSGVHTFTVAFAEEEFSEAAIARRTAAKFGTTHQEVVLTPDEMLSRLGQAVAALDQPTMDGINTYFVSWSARQAGLKVALSGLGGDEVFGGYSTFSRTAKFQQMARVSSHVPAGIRSAMASAVTQAGGGFIPADAARKIAGLWSSVEAFPDAFYFGRNLFTPAQVSELMNGANRTAEPSLWWNRLAASAASARSLDTFGAVSCMEADSYLVNTLLRDADAMSMAHSLEVRVPFLHHPLVEFVTQLPQELKLRKGTPKALLVAALEDLLPAEVVQQTKRGFTFPWETWLRGPLKEKIASGFADLSPALQKVMNEGAARGIWNSYLAGKTSWSRPWSLYVLNEWVRRNLDDKC